MKKITFLLLTVLATLTLVGCTNTIIQCGEGTVIQDGQCVAANIDDNDDETPIDDNDDETPADNEVNCDSITGTLFYQVDFPSLVSSLVDNEVGNEHTADNFVIWGKTETGQNVDNASIEDGTLVVRDIEGDQLKNYYDSGLGYQFFNFESDTNYTVCAVVEGPTGQTMKSEFGIYYGFGTKDDVDLTGEKQLIVQDFRASNSTNTDRGQYVLFVGNVTGDVIVHSIKIVINE